MRMLIVEWQGTTHDTTISSELSPVSIVFSVHFEGVHIQQCASISVA